jgi:hypothetical protein
MPQNLPFQLQMPLKWPYLVLFHFNAPRNYTFAPNKLQLHEGIDFTPKTPFTGPLFALAAQRGIVSKVAFNPQGYGNYVRIDHDWNGERWVTWYGHLERALVMENAYVNAGDQIGITGTTGFSTGIHLHLTVQHIGHGLQNYVVDDVVDPEPLLINALPAFDEATWVEDVTVQDGTVMKPGQTFLKTWRMRNTGNRAWSSGYTFAFQSGERMNGPQSIPLPPAKPGEIVSVSVNLTAPATAGNFRSTYKPRNSQGVPFDFELWAEIAVKPAGGDTGGVSELGYVSETIPDGSEMRPGQTFVKKWRVRNKGLTTWTDGYQMAFFSGERMNGPESVPLPAARPGDEVEVSVNLTAPPSPGVYRVTYKGRTPQGKFFEHEQWAEIKVVGTPQVNDAALIADGFTVPAGQPFIKTWRVRNTGETAWGNGYVVGFVSGERLGGADNIPIPAAKSGEEVMVAITLTAPAQPGVYRGSWRLRGPRGDFFGPTLQATIFVLS